jgi:hypothetical protein
MMVVCFGPQLLKGRLPPLEGTSYVSGVSALPQIDGVDTWSPLVAAYRKFILDEYGVDFAPICEPHPSESYAQEWLKSVASGPNMSFALVGAMTVVMTGWTWKPSAADTAPAPKRVERPGYLER